MGNESGEWIMYGADTCYPDHDRIYRISEKISRGSDPEATLQATLQKLTEVQ